MPNVSVALTKDSHMSIPGVIMGGNSQGSCEGHSRGSLCSGASQNSTSYIPLK